jgi:hypothetical protein
MTGRHTGQRAHGASYNRTSDTRWLVDALGWYEEVCAWAAGQLPQFG